MTKQVWEFWLPLPSSHNIVTGDENHEVGWLRVTIVGRIGENPGNGTVRLTRKRASEANGGLSYGTLPHPRHHHSRHFHLSQI